jgi:hypothetical protein
VNPAYINSNKKIVYKPTDACYKKKYKPIRKEKPMTLQELENKIKEEGRKQQEHENGLLVRGYTWAVDATAHFHHGGDDFMWTSYFKSEPTDQAIEDLKSEISHRKGKCDIDYRTRKLKRRTAVQHFIDTSKLTRAQLEAPTNKMADLVTIHNNLVTGLNGNGHEFNLAKSNTFATKAKAVHRILILTKFAKKDNKELSSDELEPSINEEYVGLNEHFNTVGEAARHMLVQKDEDGSGFSYKFIRRCILASFPKAKTSVASLRWYSSRMNEEGLVLPVRKSGKHTKKKQK